MWFSELRIKDRQSMHFGKSSRRLPALLAAGAIALGSAGLAARADASPVFYFYTFQSNAQTSLDSADSLSWSFSVAAGTSWDLGGGQFDLKDGPSTTGSIFLQLYEDGGASPVVSRTMNNAQFVNAHMIADGLVPGTDSPDDQSFNGNGAFTPVPFGTDASPVPFTVDSDLLGHSYILTLTSDAGTSGSQQYFVKGTGSGVFCSASPGSATTCDVSLQPPDTTQIPEPMTLTLLATGAIGLGVVRRRRA
jgi:hypothetical protein